MFRIEEINDIDRLLDYRNQWHDLLYRTPRANFFHTPEWLEIFWKYYGEGAKLRAFLRWQDKQLTGILPLEVMRQWTRFGPFRYLTYPLSNWGSFYGAIGEDPDTIFRDVLSHIADSPRDWDIFEPRWATESMEAVTQAGRLPFAQTLIDHTTVVDFNGNWEDYFLSLSGRPRNNFHRWQKRLKKVGELSYIRHRPAGDAQNDSDPRWDLYDACEELASRSWQADSIDGTTLCHEDVRHFLRDLHKTACRVGGADINLIQLDNKPMAFEYCYCYKGNISALRKGFDPAFGKFGAGSLLTMFMIRDSFARGDYLYDMGIGNANIKRPYGNRQLPVYRYSHYARGVPRAQLLRLKRWLVCRINRRKDSVP